MLAGIARLRVCLALYKSGLRNTCITIGCSVHVVTPSLYKIGSHVLCCVKFTRVLRKILANNAVETFLLEQFTTTETLARAS
jgi:hypothetical protein